MANRFKGEVETSTGHKMVLDYNALVELEGITGRAAFDVLADLEAGKARVSDIRAVYSACLQRHHPDLSLFEAGDIASEDPEAWLRVILAASPEAGTAPDSKGKPREKKAG